MATRNLMDDQRIDTLTYHLTILTQAVTLAIAHVERLMQDPDTPARQRQLIEIVQALARVNERAMHQGLGKSHRGISHDKHLVEERVVAQYQEQPSVPDSTAQE